MPDATLTGLTANFTLPSGITGKLTKFSLKENFRWKDSEGFVDAGHQTGKLTGQGLTANVVGHVVAGAIGMGTYFDGVAFVAQSDTGRTVSFSGSITDIELGAQVGELQTFSATIKSSGAYTSTV